MSVLYTPGGSIRSLNGEVLHFTMEDFAAEIGKGSCCFICGAEPKNREFNNEHVIPDWVLRRYSLHGRSVTLPNGTKHRYSSYKVPCCSTCNSSLGELVENPVREILVQGNDAVNAHMEAEGPWLFFKWLNLLFLKTHLKDKYLRRHLDRRRGGETLDSEYEWQELHQIQCVCRSHLPWYDVDPRIVGSFFTLPATTVGVTERFDYYDVHDARTVLVRIEDTAFVCVLDDACGSFSLFYQFLERVEGSLSPVQLREIAARLAHVSLKMEPRPNFFYRFDGRSRVLLSVETAAVVEAPEPDEESLGVLLEHACGEMVRKSGDPAAESKLVGLRKGDLSFVHDDGAFIRDPLARSANESAGNG